MRKPFIAGNWKMIGSSESNQLLLDKILSQRESFASVDVALFPPAVYLQQVQQTLKGTGLGWGTQNLSQFEEGAYTGEIAAAMLSDFGCQYVLIGHSERRCLYAELNIDQRILDHILAEKYEMAIRHGITPIVCIGESPDEHAQGRTEEIVSQLLDKLIQYRGVDLLSKCVLAYEPVWAIGTGKSATPDWAQDVHAFMRQRIAKHSSDIANTIRILYGGSVKGNNAAPLFAKPDIDGGLIGGSSRDAEDFVKICQAATQS